MRLLSTARPVPLFLAIATAVIPLTANAVIAPLASGTTTYTIDAATLDWSSGFQVDKFDGSLGTLTEINLALKPLSGSPSSYLVEGMAGSNGRARWRYQIRLEVLLASNDRSLLLTSGTERGGVSNMRAGQMFSFGESVDIPENTRQFTDTDNPGLLNRFTDNTPGNGLGKVNLIGQASIRELRFTASGENWKHSFSGMSGLELDVNYVYTPVPEAGTWLAGAGLLVIAFGGFARNRRRQT